MRYKLLLEGYFKNADAFSVAYDKVNNCVVLTSAGGVQEELPDGWLDDLMQFIYNSCEEWSDYDDEYPDNTYDWGYIVNGQRLTFGHHGRAGEYWNRDVNLSIAY